MTNFHVFVLIATIINFAMIRKASDKGTTPQVIRSTLLLPIVSYVIYFFITQKEQVIMETSSGASTQSSVDIPLMSASYPPTVSVTM